MRYLTFVTPKAEKDFDLWIKKSYPDITIDNREVFDGRTIQWQVAREVSKSTLDAIRSEFKIDVFYTDGTPVKLFMADMDSTIVRGETLDDMAVIAGIGDKIAAITERAMRGELDFKAALNERVRLLAGQPASIIDQALAEIRLNAGAEKLLSYLKSKGVYCVLVSGGFTQFTSHVAEQLGFDAHFGNVLIIDEEELTGEVVHPILDKNFKLQKLQQLQKTMNLSTAEIMAIGDGANDLPMLNAAGIGVAYYGKPLLRDELINQINYTDLSSLVYLF